MNILYCGDANILDGLIISILSILKNTNEILHIYLFTMKFKTEEKEYTPLTEKDIKLLKEIVKNNNKDNFIKLIDVTKEVNSCLPVANINTFFTPYCMLRLYADLVENMPDKLLYLDNDVVCLKNPQEFYNILNDNYEIVGVLDYYGSHVYKKNLLKKDYVNSGVLLLNMKLIKETGLFAKCRKMCHDMKMLLPDQTALNFCAKHKLVVARIYNEQKEAQEDTVFRHFSTTFKFWPKFSTQTIKPWQIDEVHNILNMHNFDDILDDYKLIKERMKK